MKQIPNNIRFATSFAVADPLIRMPHALMRTWWYAGWLLATTFSLISTAAGYGPAGHEIVGAIADERLANTGAGKRITDLLEGMTLEKASVIADEIKGWDSNGVDGPNAFHYSRHPGIDAQLADFWRANPPVKDPASRVPSHHWFHYTDVPLVRPEKYEDGLAGRSQWDVVHMIGYCVDVLREHIPGDNERKITKPIAVVLLAHLVGDIHQPLHVGAEYFDKAGNVVDPDNDKTALADEGGNTLTFVLSDRLAPAGTFKRKFHAFWDLDCVNALLPLVPPSASREERHALLYSGQQKLAHELAAHEPCDWRTPAELDLSLYAENWADEILPIAGEAHQRVLFRHIAPAIEDERIVAAGEVEEKSGSAGDYRKWATDIVREELHKAGWRLADLLEKSAAPAAAAAVKSTSSAH